MSLSYVTEEEKRKKYLTPSRNEEMRKTIKISLKSSPPSILDIAASEGKTFSILLEELKKREISLMYVATELSDEMIEKLKNIQEEEGAIMEIVKCPAYSLPFRDNSFSVAFSLNVINWLPMDQTAHIKELKRVGKEWLISFYSKIKNYEGFEDELENTKREIESFCKKYGKFLLKSRDKIGELSLYYFKR
jgi:ubiquinone/menaquinone biosynthesis C-methylase UbiE